MDTHADKPRQRPCVLCLSGLDPSGGAGIQADIEAIMATGAHCLPVLTSLTVQNTRNVDRTQPVSAGLINDQLESLFNDLPVRAIKLGLIDSIEVMELAAHWLQKYPDIPVVGDPVLSASGGFQFNHEKQISAWLRLLLPLSTVVTPNTLELHKLAPGHQQHDEAAAELLRSGARHVLLTGTHDNSEEVANRLYSAGALREWRWPRLPQEYHGSGCTLASALASALANGLDLEAAAEQAQHYTWETLAQGIRPGRGQYIPDRSARE